MASGAKIEISEKLYCDRPLRNRLLNELYREIVPVILAEDDSNAMQSSLENRSPYLDSKLIQFACTIPDALLIRDGYAKAVLRDALKGTLVDTVRLERKKVGFNASIESVAHIRSKEFRDWVLSDSQIFESISKSGLSSLLEKKDLSDLENRFLFTVISTRLFYQSRNGDVTGLEILDR